MSMHENIPCEEFCKLKESRILIVDDSKETARLVEKFLHAMQVRNTITATSVKEAVAVLFNNKVDLIISDYKMDQIDGISFLRLLRSGASADAQTRGKLNAYRSIPFLVLTGAATKDVIEAAVDCGAFAVMAKPLKPQVLQDRLKSMLYVHCPMNCFRRS